MVMVAGVEQCGPYSHGSGGGAVWTRRAQSSSEDDEAAWASSDGEAAPAADGGVAVQSPTALAGAGASGDYYSGSEGSFESAETTAAPISSRRDASLEVPSLRTSTRCHVATQHPNGLEIQSSRVLG